MLRIIKNLLNPGIAAYSKQEAFHTSAIRMPRALTQGITGEAALITGDFRSLTLEDKNLISHSLKKAQQTLVLVNDRNVIQTPANERAQWIRKTFNDMNQLQVMVVYGAPEKNEDYLQFIKNKIPKNIKITHVYCQQQYSSDLAKALGALHQLIPKINKTETLYGDSIARFQNPIPFHPEEEINIKQKIALLNPNHPNQEVFFKRIKWDMQQLNRKNLPLIVGEITDSTEKKQFSDPNQTQVYDMPIYIPNQGWQIPQELSAYTSVIKQIVHAEQIANPNINQCVAYLTIDSGVVSPNHYARRSGLHVDGFVSKANETAESDGEIYGDNTYIVCDDLGTEFYPGPFDMSKVDQNDPQKVLNAFEEQGKQMPYTQAIPYKIYRMTVNNVHAVHPNDTQEYRQRSFLKMTFSVRVFNRLGSTINPLFEDLSWNYIPRTNQRNTQNHTGSCPSGYIDTNLKLINYQLKKGPSWCGDFFSAKKRSDILIHALPVPEGTYVETRVGEHLVTVNFAGKGYMQVSRNIHDSYLLPQNKFNRLYEKTSIENHYKPIDRVLKATTISKAISVIGLWGTRQNLPEGSVVVSDGNEAWGIHPESFSSTYISLN